MGRNRIKEGYADILLCGVRWWRRVERILGLYKEFWCTCCICILRAARASGGLIQICGVFTQLSLEEDEDITRRAEEVLEEEKKGDPPYDRSRYQRIHMNNCPSQNCRLETRERLDFGNLADPACRVSAVGLVLDNG
ncbi:hypothetical protein I7I51_07297 [Histoplasma capsulatum]|uniref:Uncharacterized protein n=1 Tax=Ajellomyces capsulatus TaxID=5037 RepID=A0A8A1MMN1_AJECA|nr:hypothetical protein I7I51_07297 [Histoplasma capsulatum]